MLGLRVSSVTKEDVSSRLDFKILNGEEIWEITARWKHQTCNSP